jgi:hypothetical protein
MASATRWGEAPPLPAEGGKEISTAEEAQAPRAAGGSLVSGGLTGAAAPLGVGEMCGCGLAGELLCDLGVDHGSSSRWGEDRL